MAAFSSANPDNISAVEVVKMFLKVTLPTESYRAVVEEAHGALVLLRGWCNKSWGRMRCHVVGATNVWRRDCYGRVKP